MSFVMNRKAMVFLGRHFNGSEYTEPAPNVAFVCGDRPGERRIVTWDEVMENRRKHQMERLEVLRRDLRSWHAYRVTVTYYDMPLMGGWQAHVDNHITQHHSGGWIDRDRRWLKPLLMKAFPLILSLGTEADQWAIWKVAFAKQYQRGKHDGRPRGCAFVWWNERDEPMPVTSRLLTRPE